MDIADYHSQDTKAWPGKIALVVTAGPARRTVKDVEQELQKSFNVEAVVFEGDFERQSDFPIMAKRIKLRNKLIRLNTDGTNPAQLKTLIERRLVDYVSVRIPAPLYADAYAKAGAKGFDQVRETMQLLESAAVPHDVTLLADALSEADIKDAASQVRNSFVLYADKPFDELRALATKLTGPEHIRIRNKQGEQSIS